MEPLFDFCRLLVERSLAGGAVSAEAFFSRSSSRRLRYRDREEEGVSVSDEQGFALRLTAAGHTGFAYLSAADERTAERAVAEALVSARLGDEPAVPFGAGVAPAEIPGLDDPEHEARPEKEKRALAERQIEEAFAVSPKVSRVKSLVYGENRFSRGVVTSEGCRAGSSGTLYSLACSVMAKADGDSEVAHEWTSARTFGELARATVGRDAAERADGLLGGRPVSTGRYAVVLDPEVSATLLSLLASAVSGELLVRGTSPLAGSLGKRVASEPFTVVDDGLLPGGYASAPVDDEGVARSRRTVIREGMLEGFLLDRRSAALLSLEPTGNGCRGDYKAPPATRPANLHVSPGEKPRGELLSELSEGLYVVDVMGAHTMDPISGNVSLGASGFVVEGGRPGRPFRGVTVSGSLYEMIRRVSAAGSDLRFFGEVGSPALLLEELDVAGQD